MVVVSIKIDFYAALEPTEVPAFKPGLSSNVMARTGQKVRLECVISAGLPKPSVLWLHNNKPVKETRDIKVFLSSFILCCSIFKNYVLMQFFLQTLVEGNRHLLTITEAFPKDAGTYTVVARNPAGEAITTCNLAVKVIKIKRKKFLSAYWQKEK